MHQVDLSNHIEVSLEWYERNVNEERFVVLICAGDEPDGEPVHHREEDVC